MHKRVASAVFDDGALRIGGSPHPTADRAAVDPRTLVRFRYERLSPARRVQVQRRFGRSTNAVAAGAVGQRAAQRPRPLRLLPRHEHPTALESRLDTTNRTTVRRLHMAYFLSLPADAGVRHILQFNPAAGRALIEFHEAPSSAAIRS